MYNPCRGGVRGGADQFTWESVKTDKHRENYLGHSLKAPVGRWQKGKDLSWYAKERKNDDESEKMERSQMAAIKRAEEEAMLIALGHKVTRKESQPLLSKEEMTEALKRNIGDRDDHNIERIDGVGSSNRRAALLTSGNKDSRSKNEGVFFERHKERKPDPGNNREHSPSHKRSKSKKKLKKHKKEKKSKHSYDDDDVSEDSPPRTKAEKHKKEKKSKHSYDDDDNDVSEDSPLRRKAEKHQRKDPESHRDSSPPLTCKEKHKKRSKHKHHHDSSGSESTQHRSSKKRSESHKSRHDSPPRKRHRHDTSDSD